MKKRLVVYLIYDKENIIDSYIGYILKELKTIASSVVVIVQGNSIERGKENLEWADQVYYRKNIGFDVGGFKDALCQLIGWEKVYEFDELVLVNDSFFGPFQSMRSIFEYMNKYDYDFWGITEHALFKDDEIEIPEHIQSYYCTFRNRILHSSEFREYWEQVPYYKNFNEVVQKHEIILTRYFSDFGYKYGCLADMEPNNSEINYKNNLTQYKFLQYELIEKRKCPILKKKPLAYDTLDLQTQENCKLALNYIKNETSYDVDMIWENLIRIMDISDIQKKFHLQYIVKVNDRKAEFQNIKIIVMASYPDAAEYVFERLKYIKEKNNIVVIAPNDFVKSIYEKEGYPAYSEKEIDKFHFWHSLNLERYLVCILHDCDVSNNVEPSCKGKSFFYGIWNNLLDNFDYAKSIINLFNEDKRLGALSPPIPKFSTYFGKLEWEWNYYFTNIQKLLKQKDISCQISKDKMPLTVSSSIWVRGNILKKVIEYKLLDNKILPYIWMYIAQSLGYYVGIVESENYASLNEINQQVYLTQIISQVQKYYGKVNSFQDLQMDIFKGKMMEFCNYHKRIYVYGIGEKTKQYMSIIPNVEGYIVSDGQVKPDAIREKRVYYLSEIVFDSNIGIILCLNESNQAQVIPLLKNKRIDYLCI